jgi:hypothetical protein
VPIDCSDVGLDDDLSASCSLRESWAMPLELLPKLVGWNKMPNFCASMPGSIAGTINYLQ